MCSSCGFIVVNILQLIADRVAQRELLTYVYLSDTLVLPSTSRVPLVTGAAASLFGRVLPPAVLCRAMLC